MTSTTTTVLDRYIGLADTAVQDPGVLEQLRTIFAEDATVHVFGDPVTGIEAIIEFYRGLYAMMAESRHLWTTTRVDDGTLEAPWAAAVRFADGRLMGVGGFERAHVNADGLITHLRNYPSQAES